jgi:predicted PurR-regulated permease PerM
MGKDVSRDATIWVFISLFLISSFMMGWLIKPFLPIIILAFVVTGVFNPIYNFFLNKKIKPSVSSLITCLIIFVTIFIPFVFLIGVLSKETYSIYIWAKNAVLNETIKDFLEEYRIFDRINLFLSNFDIELSINDLKEWIASIGKPIGLFLYKQASGIASNLLSFLINFFFMLLITFFLLIDNEKLISFIYSLSPLPEEQNKAVLKRFKDMSGAVLIGNGISGAIQGVAGGVVFAVFGFESSVLWGIIMGLLAFMPIVGIGMALIPAAIYLLLLQKIAAGVFFIIFYIILSLGMEYIVKPRIVGGRVKMNTLLIFLAIIGGLKLFGILGIIYGPLIATAFLTFSSIYKDKYQEVIENKPFL